MAVVRLASGVFTIRGPVSGVLGPTISRLGFGVFVLTIPRLGFGVFTIVRLGSVQGLVHSQDLVPAGVRRMVVLQRAKGNNVFLGEVNPELIFLGLPRETVTLSLTATLGRQRGVLRSIVIDDRLQVLVQTISGGISRRRRGRVRGGVSALSA